MAEIFHSLSERHTFPSELCFFLVWITRVMLVRFPKPTCFWTSQDSVVGNAFPRYRWDPAEYDNTVSVPLPFSKVYRQDELIATSEDGDCVL